MGKLRILIVMLLLLVVLICVGFATALYLFRSGVETSVPLPPALPVNADPALRTGRLEVSQFRTIDNKPYECALVFAEKGEFTEGTAFIAGNLLRVDALLPSGLVASLVVAAELFTYRESMPSTVALSWASADTSVVTPRLLGEVVSYTCKPWVVDASVFTLRHE
jgi:hypothetical protein